MSPRGQLIHLPANRVWRTYPGGRTLDELARLRGEPLAGGSVPADTHLAEDWIASTTRAVNPPQAYALPDPKSQISDLKSQISDLNSSSPPGISRVRIGDSPTLHDFAALLASDPAYFLGPDHARKYGPQPQLLVKFLDSGTRLHFQVHPTRDFARRVLGAPSGKTEAYHVLAVRDPAPISNLKSQISNASPAPAAEATGYIYVGFQRPPDPARLRAWIVTQDLAAIEACFDRIPVRPGDTFIIPGGTPHALGAGVFMVEIQEPSDLVIRFEFERAGFVLPEASRFMHRDVDFGLTVFNFAPLPPAELDRRVRCSPRRIRTFDTHSWQEELIGPDRTDCFRVLKTHLRSPVVKDENAPVIAIVTEGTVLAEVAGRTSLLQTFDKVFLPAGLGPVRFTPQGPAALLECLPPT
jgi:mannose-6-phosphate isomerase